MATRTAGAVCRRVRYGWIVLAAVCAWHPAASAQELVLGDFGIGGDQFDYTFGGFTQTVTATGVTLIDPTDNSGGAGIGLGGLNLGAYGDARLAVDFTPLAGNGAPRFDIELIDTSAPGGGTQRSGKWSFNLSGLTPGVSTRVFAQTTLANPTFGIGDFQNLDLSQVSTWQVLGDFSTPSPFRLDIQQVSLIDAPPPPAYPGAEPGAPWRAEAATRIEQTRKADLSVHVVDASGAPVPAALVDVAMQGHEFGFGSAVTAFRLRDSSPQHNVYREHVEQLFNIATLENNLKWQPWEGAWGSQFTQAGAVAALDWLGARGIRARGHVLVWPGADNLPSDIAALLSDNDLTPAEQATVRTRIANHIADIASAVDGKVEAWDVINETRTNNDLMRELSEGNQAMVDWLQQAAVADPDATRYINDFGILNSWGAGFNRNQYFNTIQYLLDQGAPLEGIGFQGHFTDSDLTGPEELWDVLDRFAELGLDMQVTEFDINTTDEQLQADYTRDFLTAMFAHEGIDDVLFWGFWENAHWRPDAALFRSDWSIKPNGQAYLDLVFDEWWTDETGESDGSGEFSLRGFKGDYLVSASFADNEVTASVSLSDGGESVVLTLPMLLGDYNSDGVVDSADYTVWRDTLNSTTQLAADGNNDGVVDIRDFELWRNRYGAQALLNAAIPEPSSVVAMVASVSFTAAMLRRTRRPAVHQLSLRK